MRSTLLSLILLASLAGCGSAPMSKFNAGASPSAPATEGTTLPLTAASSAQPAERRIIYKATLWLTVADFAETEGEIAALVKASGGYVASFRDDRRYGNLRGGQWVLRVPVAQFDGVLDGASKLGVPTSREVEAEDITEEYVDLSARLKSKQGIEARLLELVQAKAGEIKDVVAVETELGRVREEVERIEGRLRFLADRTALTTVTIHAYEQRGYRPEQATLIGKISSSLWASIDGMRSVAEGALLAAVAVAPWLVLLLVIMTPVIWVLRRLGRSKYSIAAPSSGS